MEIPELKAIPFPSPEAGRSALSALLQTRNILNVLESVHQEMGDIFRIPLPGFNPIFLVGAEANKFITVSNRDDFKWRSENDPVSKLLGNGLLVTDGEFHDSIRHSINPALHKRMLPEYFGGMIRRIDEITQKWHDNDTIDMLVEMRKIALLIIMDTLFKVDFSRELPSLWNDILNLLKYISPGIWVIFPNFPRPGYKKSIKKIDSYFYNIIAERRRNGGTGSDLLSLLVSNPFFDDKLIRDQLLTIFIAGHDTSTATLAWSLFLLASHPNEYSKVQDEIDQTLGKDQPSYEAMSQLKYLDMVIHESLRLYPPIHIGNRIAVRDIDYQGYLIPSGTRVVYSIYLSQRHKQYWSDPENFIPERFNSEENRTRLPYTYLPFGGGGRNCIGMAFAMVETKLVLARIIQKFKLKLPHQKGNPISPYMGATLEPRPGVKVFLSYR